MNITELKRKIEYFRSLGQEGGYWDFKRQWYEDKGELLLDIICMANNIDDKDAYIILGIDDNLKVCGVENDTNRLKLNQLSQFISTGKFARYAPEINLQTIDIEDHKVDIIIIPNSNRTPFYLQSDFNFKKSNRKIIHGEIYIRINDTKGGVDRCAPDYAIEHLWRKRFGIHLPIMERLSILLSETDNWIIDWGNKNYAYHKIFPEFRIQELNDPQKGWMPAAAFYVHPNMYLSTLNIMYHSTVVFETELWYFDEFRKRLPRAQIQFLPEKNCSFLYYDLNSIEGKMLKIFTGGTNDISSREPNYHQILIFDNIEDKENFTGFLKQHFSDFTDEQINTEYKFQINEDNPTNGGGMMFSAFQVAKAAKIYEVWLNKKSELTV